MEIEKLVNLTYSKIFFEDLHIIQKDIEGIKNIILSSQKLITKKLDRVFFISDLAEKIKIEKINLCIEQKRKYGEVLMQNFEEIFIIYNWLVNSDFEDNSILKLREVSLYKWEIEDNKLVLLFEKLKGIFINSQTPFNVFKTLFSGRTLKSVDKKIEWLKVAKNGITNKKSITDLIDILAFLKIISKPKGIKQVDENKILSTFFCSKKGGLKFTNSNFTKLNSTSEYRLELEEIINSIL